MNGQDTVGGRMAKRYVAACGILGARRRRIGTRYFYDLQEALRNSGAPYFRWRNDEHRRAALKTAGGGE